MVWKPLGGRWNGARLPFDFERGRGTLFEDKKKEDLIRREAHLLWLAEGKPEGRDKAHWREAERLVERTEGAHKRDQTRLKSTD